MANRSPRTEAQKAAWRARMRGAANPVHNPLSLAKAAATRRRTAAFEDFAEALANLTEATESAVSLAIDTEGNVHVA